MFKPTLALMTLWGAAAMAQPQEAPTLLGPMGDQGVAPERLNFVWTHVEDALWYRLTILHPDGNQGTWFSASAHCSEARRICAVAGVDFDVPGDGQWQVKPWGMGDGPVSEWMSFSLGASEPTLLSPLVASTSPRPTYTWTSGIGDDDFQLTVTTDLGEQAVKTVTRAEAGCPGEDEVCSYTPEVTLTPSAQRCWSVQSGAISSGTECYTTTQWHTIEQISGTPQGAGVAVGQLDDDPRPDLVAVVYLDENGDPHSGPNQFYVRIGWNLDHAGHTDDWDWHTVMNGFGHQGQGAGVELIDLNQDGYDELIFMANDNPQGANSFRYQVYATSGGGLFNTLDQSDVLTLPGLGNEAQGAGISTADLDGNGSPEMLVMAYDNPNGPNSFRYRVARDLGALGAPGSMGHQVEIAGLGDVARGAGIAIGDFDGDGAPGLALLANDAPCGREELRLKISHQLHGSGVAGAFEDTWHIPSLEHTAAAALTAYDIDEDGKDELIAMVATDDVYAYRVIQTEQRPGLTYTPPAFADQADADGDGLADAVENALGQYFAPYVRFDSDEHARRPHEPATLLRVSPIRDLGEAGEIVQLRYLMLFEQDGGYLPLDTAAHWRDTATVKLHVRRTEHAGQSMFTLVSAQVGDRHRWVAGSGAECTHASCAHLAISDPIFQGGHHIQVYPAAGTHTLYLDRSADHLPAPSALVPGGLMDHVNGCGLSRQIEVYGSADQPQPPAGMQVCRALSGLGHNNVGEGPGAGFVEDLDDFCFFDRDVWSAAPFGEAGHTLSVSEAIGGQGALNMFDPEAYASVSRSGRKVALMARNHRYVHLQFLIDMGIGQTTVFSWGDHPEADMPYLDESSTFEMIELGNNQVAFKGDNGHFITAEDDLWGSLTVHTPWIGPWEIFTLEPQGNGRVALRTVHDRYVGVSPDGEILAYQADVGFWEMFELQALDAGPVALQTAEGFFVGQDPDGSMISDAIAPLPLQMVSVGEEQVGLRLPNGRFVGVEGGDDGEVYSDARWLRSWEKFDLIELGFGFVALSTGGAHHLRDGEDGLLVADGAQGAQDTRFTLVDLAGTPVAIQGVDGRYVQVTPNGIALTGTQVDASTTFDFVNLGGLEIALRHDGEYVRAVNGGGGQLLADRSWILSHERFDLVPNADGTISLRTATTQQFVTAENGGGEPLVANRPSNHAWERFRLIALPR
ncbi:MAG: hypothetical protein ACE366_26250 [Bradymonadia bacterium]